MQLRFDSRERQRNQPQRCTLRAEQVKALHLLGPDYRSTFSPTESSAVLEQARRAVSRPIGVAELLKIYLRAFSARADPVACTSI